MATQQAICQDTELHGKARCNTEKRNHGNICFIKSHPFVGKLNYLKEKAWN